MFPTFHFDQTLSTLWSPESEKGNCEIPGCARGGGQELTLLLGNNFFCSGPIDSFVIQNYTPSFFGALTLKRKNLSNLEAHSLKAPDPESS